MKILTYNLGLLDHLFTSVPKAASRSRFFGPYLSESFDREQIDVALLQEIWSLEDVERLRDSLEDRYLVLCPPKEALLASGLVTILRKSWEWKLLDFHFFEYRQLYFGSLRAIHEIITGFRRGAIFTRIENSEGQAMVIANTHLTPFEKNFGLRGRQLQSLSSRLKEILRPTDFLIIGGDINHSTSYLKPADKKKALKVLEDFTKEWRLLDPAENLLTYDPQRNSLAALCKWGNAGKPLSLDRIWLSPADKIDYGPAALYAEKNCAEAYPLSDHFGVTLEIRLSSASSQLVKAPKN